MTCNCDNNGSNEYIIELGEQGIPGQQGEKGDPGFSPTVTYTGDNTGIQFNIINETETFTTPIVPLESYVSTAFLKVDGSNANNPITLNGLTINKSGGSPIVTGDINLYLRGSQVSISANPSLSPTVGIAVQPNTISLGDVNTKYLVADTDTVKYGRFGQQSEIATLADIPGVTGYLEVDGSNADNQFTVNGVELAGNSIYISNVASNVISATQTNSNIYYQLGLDSNRAYLTMPSFTLNSYPAISTGGSFSPALALLNSSGDIQISTASNRKLYYGANQTANNEVAIKGDIPTVSDATITINQGGVTKGTFTLNGSATTINLDAGGGGAVDSVNGQTGDVVLNAQDVGALPDSTVIPTVNNPTITFTQGGTTKGTITLNQSSDQTIDFDAVDDNPLQLLTDLEGLLDVTSLAQSSFSLNNFTQIGSPEVTNDGVFVSTPTTGADYIETPVYLATNDLRIEFEFALVGGDFNGLLVNWENSIYQGLFINSWGATAALFGASNLGGQNFIAAGHSYRVYLQWNADNTTELGLAKDDSGAWITSNGTWSGSLPSNFLLGYRYTGNGKAIFDLKKVKIISNDTVIFSGKQTGTDIYNIGNSTVTIPYTLSKTGSKIVDSAYRDRVEQVYLDQGYVRYYTLDEGVNYTLPTPPDKGYLPNLSWVLNNINSVPDYEHAITLAEGSTLIASFTAPDDGYIFAHAFTTGGTYQGYINDVNVVVIGTTPDTVNLSQIVPIKKGDVYYDTIDGTLGGGARKFIPMREI